MSHPDARRARWRADLLDYGAAAQASVGLDHHARAAQRAASTNRDYADLMDELAAAKAAGDPDVLRAVKQRVHLFRFSIRGSHRVLGNETVNDFAEPSDAELIEIGY